MNIWLWYWKLRRGDSIEQTITLKANWTAINLTWCNVKFTMKQDYSDVNPIITQELLITDAINWICKLVIDKNITSNWKIWMFHFDIEFTDSLWKRQTPLVSQVEILYDIT